MYIYLLLLLLLLHVPSTHQCTSDQDCPIQQQNCILGQCTSSSTGEYCTKPQDCASYSVLGLNACSGPCTVVSGCGPVPSVTPNCCLGVPENAPCSKPNQCENGLVCQLGVCSKVETNKWLIGLVISITGSIVLNLGLNVQKYAFRQNESLPELDRKPAHHLPLWIFGFIIWIIGNLSNFVALSFAAQSLVASLGAVSLVTNALAAPIINKEPFGVIDLVSILFISAGTVIVVLFSTRTEISYSLCALLKLYTQVSVLVYLALVSLLVLILYLFMQLMQVNMDRFQLVNASSESLMHLRQAGATRPSMLHTLLNHPRLYVKKPNAFVATRIVLPFSYACMGGTLGGLTVMFAKSAATLISLTLEGSNQFVYLPTYAILLGIFVTGIGQVYYINQGLKRYDALLQVPCFYVVYTLSSIVSGGIYFSEFDSFSSFQFMMFITGVSLTFIGVACLTGRISPSALVTTTSSSSSDPSPTSSQTEPTAATHKQDAIIAKLLTHKQKTRVSPMTQSPVQNVLAGYNEATTASPLLHTFISNSSPVVVNDQLLPGSVP